MSCSIYKDIWYTGRAVCSLNNRLIDRSSILVGQRGTSLSFSEGVDLPSSLLQRQPPRGKDMLCGSILDIRKISLDSDQ
jgi:hypothetical protein